jgi:hypothetical protein
MFLEMKTQKGKRMYKNKDGLSLYPSEDGRALTVKHRIENSYVVDYHPLPDPKGVVVRWFPPGDVIPRGHWNCSSDGDTGIQYAEVCDHVRAVRKWRDQHE